MPSAAACIAELGIYPQYSDVVPLFDLQYAKAMLECWVRRLFREHWSSNHHVAELS